MHAQATEEQVYAFTAEGDKGCVLCTIHSDSTEATLSTSTWPEGAYVSVI